MKTICVFCASSDQAAPAFKQAARDMGAEIGRREWTMVYGGASIGLMGEAARAVHSSGGKVVGVIPQFLMEKEIGFLDADEMIVTPDMRKRKTIMEERSDAFIALPGGIGTLEEIMEILTLIHLQVTSKPMVLVNIDGYYDALIRLFQNTVDHNLTAPKFMKSFTEVRDVDSAIHLLTQRWGL
ncbi:MAG: TIGR00730 family Rossman fold protein [Candidatus Nitrohelix vancouverensis]|uniref:Cytokinin riboside 5'-monophosphate phosphoribohydrolase n=1 Tax=Candidatus Nitrohelix vancouverensis TaxID=2705534 RepID=A0A7T0C1Y9_9BACT|nr:MAG: TIGR00730 family Rossman fold protein [Candidatus Nitrohelix vancouverensis]